MEDLEHIQPYNDEEVVAALQKLARHPVLPVISKYIFPEFPVSTLKEMLMNIKGVDDFQYSIVSKAVSVVVGRSSSGFTYDGVENLFFAIVQLHDLLSLSRISTLSLRVLNRYYSFVRVKSIKVKSFLSPLPQMQIRACQACFFFLR